MRLSVVSMWNKNGQITNTVDDKNLLRMSTFLMSWIFGIHTFYRLWVRHNEILLSFTWYIVGVHVHTNVFCKYIHCSVNECVCVRLSWWAMIIQRMSQMNFWSIRDYCKILIYILSSFLLLSLFQHFPLLCFHKWVEQTNIDNNTAFFLGDSDEIRHF